MEAKRDGNYLLTIDENAIRKTHNPDRREVDVRSLHELINEILKPFATATAVEGVPYYDQVMVDSHLKSFKSSSCLQELVKMVHKIYSQLSCKCSGGRDLNSTTVAVFNTLSRYSWEAKMVVVLAAFAVFYGEWWVMEEQTDPLAESIKVLKQLSDKSKLSKILSLIDAIVKVTNTILKVADVKESLPDNISMNIETAVSWTVGSVIVCTSHIISLDDEYTEDVLSKLTGKVVGMNTQLAGLLSTFEQNVIVWPTIDENEIWSTHAPDGKNVNVRPLHKLINEILKPFATTSVEGAPQDPAVLDSHLKIFKNNSEELAKIVHKICYQLRCKSSGGGVTKSTIVALFRTLSRYSWEAKLVLALAAFAVIYGEWSLMVRKTNPLVESIKLLKQLPDKPKLSMIRSLLIDAILKVTDTIIGVVEVDDSPLPEKISTQIRTVVSKTTQCIIVCTTHIIGFVGLDDEYTEYDPSRLTKIVDGLNTNLRQVLGTWRHSIEEKKERINQALQNEDALEILINPKPGEKRLVENKEEVTQVLRKSGLETSNLIFAIDFTASNHTQGKNSFNNQSLHAMGNTRNPYEQAIAIVGATLAPFAKDNLIRCYGFGDASTTDQKVFSFHNDNTPCKGFEDVLTCYKQIVPNLTLSGWTSFAPAIEAAINVVEKSGGQHHVLVIIADGQVTSEDSKGNPLPYREQTIKSIVNASNSYALSIVVVGVGDGPWGDMNKFATQILGRKFDNFQFVDFTDIMSKDGELSQNEALLALVALMKTPKQYKESKKHGFLGRTTGKANKVDVRPPPPSKHG